MNAEESQQLSATIPTRTKVASSGGPNVAATPTTANSGTLRQAIKPLFFAKGVNFTPAQRRNKISAKHGTSVPKAEISTTVSHSD